MIYFSSEGYPMRYFSFNDYSEYGKVHIETVSEGWIKVHYYPVWLEKMYKKYGKEEVDNTFSFDDCLDDWIVSNLAWEVKD